MPGILVWHCVYQALPQEQNVTGQFGGPCADGDGERDPYESGL